MSISGITNLNHYAAMQMAKTQFQNQASAASAVPKTAAAATGPQKSKPASFDDVAGRMANIPDLEQYEDVIARFLSGESEMEDPGSGKPLTEDQITLRRFMRAYMSTDTRSVSEISASLQNSSKNFIKYWQENGNGAPPPARITSADGSFKIINSREERNEHIRQSTTELLKTAMEVIQSRKNSGGIDIEV